ncbi:MAG: hypothetical protein FJZ75_10115 [Bacteroidetes bacterium]|nr:hypothetical protein [Bacteroidota bacterium]
MKRLALLLVLILLACGSQKVQSQNTLSFSRAILVGTTTDTVPSNKVWKVESYIQANVSLTNQTNGGGCSNSAWQSPFYINQYMYYNTAWIGNGISSFYQGNHIPFPLWLPAGTTLKTTCAGDYLSVLEFTVQP